jgi:signal transduction histidine kinase
MAGQVAPPDLVSFEVEEGPPVWAAFDSMLLGQVLQNLLHNAVQAMPSGGPIRITLGEDEAMCWFRVRDAGPGVKTETLPAVFSPFFTTRAQGIGLGLAVCRRIVEAHGGSIRAENDARGGAAFTVELPKE